MYESLLNGYRESDGPLAVDFRSLLPMAGTTERATHLLHPYPAKLLRHIPALMVSAPQLRTAGDLVLDPFCGSGTVLLEAALAERPAVGIDINPLAVLISRVKTAPVDSDAVREALESILREIQRPGTTSVPNRGRLEYWFGADTLEGLAKIRAATDKHASGFIRDLLLVALSATARQLSLANPRVSVPVRLRLDAYAESNDIRRSLEAHLHDVESADAAERFSDNVAVALRRLDTLDVLAPTADVRVHSGDTRAVCSQLVEPSSVGTVVTSPPYLGAQKYIRASSLNLFCLNLVDPDTAFALARQSIGREHFRKDEIGPPVALGMPDADALIEQCAASNPQRAHLASTYLREMRDALGAICASLASEGSLVLVAGGNHLCGRPFDTPRFLRHFCEQESLALELHLVDTIRSRGLMTRRNRQASPISSEHVMVFRK